MLHTFMDSLREDGNRQINHHGQTISMENGNVKKNRVSSVMGGVPTYEDMTQRDEKELVEARRAFYDQAVTQRVDYLKLGEFAAKKGIPIVIITFSILYWTYGLFYYFNPAV